MSEQIRTQNWKSKQNWPIILLGILLLVNAIGLWQSIVIVDSSLYAIISKTMVVNGNYWEIFVDGNDWLDKPHFPFWVSAFFMKIFGFTTFAYKLPAFLFFLISLVYTFKIALRFYSQEVAWLSVVIVSSALHIIMSNNDVRAEPYLMGMMMGSAYHLLMMVQERKQWKHVLWAGIFIAMGVMTKGVFVIVPLGAAVFFYLLFRKELKQLLHFQWLFLIIVVAIFVLPEIYAVYVQFDMHPEKMVFDQQNVSGVKFFLWDSQFGRFFNSGPIKGNGDPFFFVHTMLWAFAPWSLYGFVVLFRYVKNIFTKQRKLEYFNLFGFVVLFLVFSISKFQLPHYTNIIFPFLAIIVASEIVIDTQNKNKLKWIVIVPTFILFSAIIPISILIGQGIIMSMVCVVVALAVYFILKSKLPYYFNILPLIIGLALFLNLVFYPFSYGYQGKTQAAYYVNKMSDVESVYGKHSYDFEYHLEKQFHFIEDLQVLETGDFVFGDSTLVADVEKNYRIERIQTFADFHVTGLTLPFLSQGDRVSVLDSLFLIKIE